MRRWILASGTLAVLAAGLLAPVAQAAPLGSSRQAAEPQAFRADMNISSLSHGNSLASLGAAGIATARAAARSRMSIQVPASVRANKRFVVKGSGPRKSAVVVQARKPGMKQWRKFARARANSRGVWRAKVRLAAGGWELRAGAGRKSATAQLSVVGRKQKVVLRKGVEELRGSEIKTVSGNPATSQSVVVGAKSLLPKVGDVVVADTSKSAPQGLLGRVTSVDQTTLTAVIEPVALDRAYRTYRVSVAARLGDISPQAQGLSAALAGVPLTLKCTKIRGNVVPHFASELDVSSLRASFDMDLANRYISLLVTGNPSMGASVTWEAALKAGCQVRVSVPSIPLGPTGLTLDLSPGIEATLEAGGGASIGQKTDARLAVGFVVYKGNVTYAKGASLKVGAPELSAAAKGSLEISLNNEVALMVAGRVGVFGSLGPAIGAELSTDSSDGVCVDVTGALQVALGIKANLFVTDWHVDLAKAKVTLGHLYKKCWPHGQLPTAPITPGAPGPPSPSPSPSSTGVTVARSSGPAGYYTFVKFPPCQSNSPDLDAVVSVHYSDGRPSSWSQSTDGRAIDSFDVQTDATDPPGVYHHAIECRVVDHGERWFWSSDTGTVIATYPVTITVTGPQPQFDVDVTAIHPGSTIYITDGGGCGPFDWATPYMDQHGTWVLYDTFGYVLWNPLPPQGGFDLADSGRWGPVAITVPSTTLPPGDNYVLDVSCNETYPGLSTVRYQSKYLPAE